MIDSFSIVAVAGGFFAGSLLVWLVLRMRVAAAREQGRQELMVDLATARERASRIPVLEQKTVDLEREVAQARVPRSLSSPTPGRWPPTPARAGSPRRRSRPPWGRRAFSGSRV